eukprot:EC793556.1.p1 GENE.EC793556.1~~EC793556.1.p1  ORF type:complete len:174 (+),score=45.26 EC793556.1:23-544(+)
MADSGSSSSAAHASATPITGVVMDITVDNAKAAMEFCQAAFGATVDPKHVHNSEDGRVMHAEVRITEKLYVFYHDEFPEYGAKTRGPKALGGTSITIHLDVATPPDVDVVTAKAVAAGAKVTMEPQDTFWHARYARFDDPFGHAWAVHCYLPGHEDKEVKMPSGDGCAKKDDE